MKKEIELMLDDQEHDYTVNDDGYSWLCAESVLQLFGKVPSKIKVTVADKNPKKKGWHKFHFADNYYAKFDKYKPANSYDQDFQGNKYVFPNARFWLRDNFGDIVGKPLFFKIEEA